MRKGCLIFKETANFAFFADRKGNSCGKCQTLLDGQFMLYLIRGQGQPKRLNKFGKEFQFTSPICVTLANVTGCLQ